MNDRIFIDVDEVKISDASSQRAMDRTELGGKRPDWTNSDWLSAWLKLARQRVTDN